MSKHQQRGQRRDSYYAVLDATLADEQGFVNRVLNTLDNGGLDQGADGRPIKAEFHRYIEQRRAKDPTASLACLDFLERAKRRISIKPVRRA
jgi:hypothetical protein